MERCLHCKGGITAIPLLSAGAAVQKCSSSWWRNKWRLPSQVQGRWKFWMETGNSKWHGPTSCVCILTTKHSLVAVTYDMVMTAMLDGGTMDGRLDVRKDRQLRC